MLPSFTTSVPPTIPASTLTDNAFSRILRVGKLEQLSLDSYKSVGIAELTNGVTNVTIPGIEITDLIFIDLHDLNGTSALGVKYLATFHAAVGTTPAYITITSYAADASVETGDDSIVKYMIVKPNPVLI